MSKTVKDVVERQTKYESHLVVGSPHYVCSFDVEFKARVLYADDMAFTTQHGFSAPRKRFTEFEKWDVWNRLVASLASANSALTVPEVLDSYSILAKRASEVDSAISTLFVDLRSRYSEYLNEMESKEMLAPPSGKSLIQVIRYFPAIYERSPDFYIDSGTGFFGFVIKRARGKELLNILIKDNSEVGFSYVKPNSGLIKISGRAYFTNKLENSIDISKLMDMVYDGAR